MRTIEHRPLVSHDSGSRIGGEQVDDFPRHLQLLGVKYYMASTNDAKAQAAKVPALHKVATSGPWNIYEVAGSSLVTPLPYQPAVLKGVKKTSSA